VTSEMNVRAQSPRPITIAVVALGGEGGGVLADWIVDLAQHGGYLAQATSVPGVAQRTGATVYYVELFTEAAAQAAGREPVTKVINSCVGCGLFGEVAHAAVLCPSFYRASIIANPTGWDRLKDKVRGAVIGWLQRRMDARQALASAPERAGAAA